MDFVLEMMDFVLEMVDLVLTQMNFAVVTPNAGHTICPPTGQAVRPATVSLPPLYQLSTDFLIFDRFSTDLGYCKC